MLMSFRPNNIMKVKLFRLSIIILAGFLLSSCVSRKKVVYFQTGEWENPVDTAVVRYEQQFSQYTLKPGDIVNISLGSVTPVEFDFIAQYAVQMGEILYLSPKTGKNGAQVFSQNNNTMRSNNTAIQTAYEDKQALGFLIDNEGMLALPKIGDVKVSGLSMYQIERLLEEKLEGYFETPKVRVQLLNYQFTVLGEVNKEGRYTTFKDKTSLIEALTMAGNCSEFADRSQIKIIRTKESTTEVIYLNLLEADFLASSHFYLYPEDIIVVAPLKAKFWREYVFPDTMQALTFVTSILSVFALIIAISK